MNTVYKAFFPILAPLIAPIIDKSHPMHMTIQRDVIQKLGSTIADIIPIVLQRIGTYQMLFGLFLHMK